MCNLCSKTPFLDGILGVPRNPPHGERRDNLGKYGPQEGVSKRRLVDTHTGEVRHRQDTRAQYRLKITISRPNLTFKWRGKSQKCICMEP